jgi:hypothetical protein
MGKCWLSVASASLAEYFYTIRSIFKKQHLPREGVRQIQLPCLDDKKCKTIVIDDYLPNNDTSELICAHASKTGDIWAHLLEKA